MTFLTSEEAAKIAAIVSTADGGCEYCVGSLSEQLADEFPEFDWTALVKEYGR